MSNVKRVFWGLFSVFVFVGPAAAEKVYLYSDKFKTSKMVDDIPVFVDADAAQSSDRMPTKKNIKKFKCLAKPRNSATLIARVGRAVEVRVHGNCTGFVNQLYVHSEK